MIFSLINLTHNTKDNAPRGFPHANTATHVPGATTSIIHGCKQNTRVDHMYEEGHMPTSYPKRFLCETWPIHCALVLQLSVSAMVKRIAPFHRKKTYMTGTVRESFFSPLVHRVHSKACMSEFFLQVSSCFRKRSSRHEQWDSNPYGFYCSHGNKT